MTDKLIISVCENFKGELEAVIASFPDVEASFFPATCDHPPIKWNKLIRTGIRCEILGNCCLPSQKPENCRLHKLEQCFHLFADQKLIEHYMQDGAYLITPGWLKNWRLQIKKWGFNKELAREFFREFACKLLLLDTGVDANSGEYLREFANFVERPFEKVPVGLGYFQLLVKNIIMEWRLEKSESIAVLKESKRKISEYAMMMDMLNRLVHTMTEKEVVQTIIDIFSMLFAPDKLFYLHWQDGQLGEFCACCSSTIVHSTVRDRLANFHEEYAWTESGKGFLLRMSYGNNTLGILEVDEIAFPQYKEHYLNLALNMVGLCGLAINNARTYQQNKQMEDKLRKSQTLLLETMGAVAKVGGWQLEVTSGELTWTKEIRQIYEVAPDLKPRLELNFYHPDDKPIIKQAIERAITYGENFDLQLRLITAKGRERQVRVFGEVEQENGKTVLLNGALQDITEYKKLLHERQLFFEVSLDMFCIASTEGYFKQLSPAWTKTLGWLEQELMAKPYIEFIHPNDVQLTIEALSEEKNVSFDNRYLCKDGSYRWLSWTTAVEKNTIYAVARDIEARKEMEEALKSAKDQAESANRAKSEFLANISHEIRTPMNAVIGFSDLLSSLLTDQKQKHYLQSIKTAGNTLIDLINDILDLSKIEAGRLEIQYDVVNFYTIINDLKNIFAIEIANKKLEFVVDLDKDLLLILDEIRLRQVLLNLVGNAIKFTKNGYIKLSTEILDKTDDKVDFFIRVTDTGIGIPKDQQTLIFESFRQQDGQSTRKYGGTGLGLAICKRLVEMMNGKISVKSKIGVGSVFEIFLQNVKLTKSTAKQEESFDFKNVTKFHCSKNKIQEMAKCPELVKKLEEEITPIWKEINVVMEINAIKDFANKVLRLGEEYNVSCFTDYGHNLCEYAQNFDILNIEKTLNSMFKLVNKNIIKY